MAIPNAVAGLLRRPARLGDEVYSAIFARIMSGEIAAGGRIGVDALARQLGVSQTPIREALGRLEAEGLVSKTHLVGYSVAPQLNVRQLAELYEMRLLIEPFAARKCADVMTDAVIGQLEALCADMAALVNEEGLDAYAQFGQLDMAFHDQIAVSADNELLLQAQVGLHSHVHLFRLVRDAKVTRTVLDEHEALVAAIKARDPDGAERAMRSHIERSHARFATA